MMSLKSSVKLLTPVVHKVKLPQHVVYVLVAVNVLEAHTQCLLKASFLRIAISWKKLNLALINLLSFLTSNKYVYSHF